MCKQGCLEEKFAVQQQLLFFIRSANCALLAASGRPFLCLRQQLFREGGSKYVFLETGKFWERFCCCWRRLVMASMPMKCSACSDLTERGSLCFLEDGHKWILASKGGGTSHLVASVVVTFFFVFVVVGFTFTVAVVVKHGKSNRVRVLFVRNSIECCFRTHWILEYFIIFLRSIFQ